SRLGIETSHPAGVRGKPKDRSHSQVLGVFQNIAILLIKLGPARRAAQVSLSDAAERVIFPDAIHRLSRGAVEVTAASDRGLPFGRAHGRRLLEPWATIVPLGARLDWYCCSSRLVNQVGVTLFEDGGRRRCELHSRAQPLGIGDAVSIVP